MKRAVIVRGRLSDPSHIELVEPVTEITGEVEAVVQSVSPEQVQTGAPARSLVSIPAIANAIHDAVGIRLQALPSAVLAALRRQESDRMPLASGK